MNYPVFNFDYLYTLEEIVRYLKFYPQHIIYLSVPLDFHVRGVIETTHQYRDDGLVIRCYWKPNTRLFHSGFTNWKDLSKRHKRGDLNLLAYEFVRFSDNDFQLDPPSKECEAIYQDKIMRRRKKKPYRTTEYQLLEHMISSPLNLSDEEFQQIIRELENQAAFEMYYENRRNEKETSGT